MSIKWCIRCMTMCLTLRRVCPQSETNTRDSPQVLMSCLSTRVEIHRLNSIFNWQFAGNTLGWWSHFKCRPAMNLIDWLIDFVLWSFGHWTLHSTKTGKRNSSSFIQVHAMVTAALQYRPAVCLFNLRAGPNNTLSQLLRMTVKRSKNKWTNCMWGQRWEAPAVEQLEERGKIRKEKLVFSHLSSSN